MLSQSSVDSDQGMRRASGCATVGEAKSKGSPMKKTPQSRGAGLDDAIDGSIKRAAAQLAAPACVRTAACARTALPTCTATCGARPQHLRRLEVGHCHVLQHLSRVHVALVGDVTRQEWGCVGCARVHSGLLDASFQRQTVERPVSSVSRIPQHVQRAWCCSSRCSLRLEQSGVVFFWAGPIPSGNSGV